jgi:hypothetical protein
MDATSSGSSCLATDQCRLASALGDIIGEDYSLRMEANPGDTTLSAGSEQFHVGSEQAGNPVSVTPDDAVADKKIPHPICGGVGDGVFNANLSRFLARLSSCSQQL